jgi:diketogulonate reductase-like aldo/keto reductase
MKESKKQTVASRRTFLATAAGAAIAGTLSPVVKAAPLLQDEGQDHAAAATAIRRVRIPSSGELLPVIGLGTSRTFDADPTAANENLVAVMQRFLDWGGSLIDSSPMYKRAEEICGTLCKKIGRDDLFYATKVWTKEGKEAGIKQMKRSAELMGTKRFDLMQVHNLVGLDVHIETLKEWRSSGQLRYVGVTEMRDMQKVEELVASGVLDFIQIPYSVTDRRVEDRVLPACVEHGVAALVMQPYQRGKLFGAVNGKTVPEWAADFDASSWGQLFLKFILGHEAVTIPIPATTKAKHMDDNMGAGVGLPLDSGARAKLIKILES